MSDLPAPRAMPNGDVFRRWWWRKIPVVVALAFAWAVVRGRGVDAHAGSPSEALVDALASRGIEARADEVAWVRGSRGVWGGIVGGGGALVRGSIHGEPADLYWVTTRLSPEGVLLGVQGVYDVSHTSGVDESFPMVRGERAVYTTSNDGIVTAIHALDLTGESPDAFTEFSRVERTQIAISNLQQTGQKVGITHHAFALDPVANKVDVAWADDRTIRARIDDRDVTLDAETGAAISGGGWVRASPQVRARPQRVVQWTVDRVRAMPWFGEENMQWVKAIAFTGLDWVNRLRSSVAKDTTANDVAEDLGSLTANQPATPVLTDPEVGWPPDPIPPILSPPLPGEGKWISLDKDAFITPTPGPTSPFVTSFVRSDKQRRETRIYVTMWDPRQIALHMEAGTVEPVSATGEAGPGAIPRTPEVMRKVVAGFNGGFQALHGEYGMQANGILYLPPKPFAATVLELRDGSTAMGSWPNSDLVPDEVLSYRQNLTAMIEDGKWNPWGRVWWGGTPPGWSDNIHTTRSAVCMTKERFVGYFWGVNISAEVLANAMLAARCDYAVHLDMNPGLAGFEFYNVQPTSSFPSLGRPLQTDWEYEGTFRDLPDWKYRARRMIKGMAHINFPQYIHLDGRDFFYLTARAILPGPALAPVVTPGMPEEGVWRTKGLPQHGFPYATAVTTYRPDPKAPNVKVRVARVDPRTLAPAGAKGTTAESPTVLAFFEPKKVRRPLGLVMSNGVFLVTDEAKSPATHLVSGAPFKGLSADVPVRGAVGVQDEDGMLVWIEVAEGAQSTDPVASVLDAFLARLGCSSRMALVGDTHALLGGAFSLSGDPAPAHDAADARLVRGTAPGARSFFDETPIVGPTTWQPLQAKRVRYFKKHESKKPDAGAPAPSAGGSRENGPGTPTPAPSSGGPPG
ncbi:MAG: hypothetical protein U0169_07760 [Polyangiaceae bacterium]